MRILIVDDDEPFRLALRNAFVRRGYEVSLAGSPAEAETSLREALPQYAVVDLRMPGGSGLDVVRALRALPKESCLRRWTTCPRSIGRNGSISTASWPIAAATSPKRRGG